MVPWASLHQPAQCQRQFMKIFLMLIIRIVALSGLLRAEDFGKHLFILSGHFNMACFNPAGYETLEKSYVETAVELVKAK